MCAQLGCVELNDQPAIDPDLLCPLWQYPPAVGVRRTDPPGTLAGIIFERAKRVLEAAPEGHAYQAGIVCDANIISALFAEKVPNCTLSDIYKAGKEPETASEDAVYSVESTGRFVDSIISAVSVTPGKTKSASARFFAKGTVNNLSSVRYVATQFQKIIQTGTAEEKDLVVTYVSTTVLGAMPHCTVTAPLQIRTWLYRDPPAAVSELAEHTKSKLLWLMLVEFVSAVVGRWPTLDRILFKTTEHRCGASSPFKMVNNDVKLRKDVFTLIRYHCLAEKRGPAPRMGRYNVTATGTRSVPVESPFDSALVAHGIKRKLSGGIIRDLGPGFARMYRGVVEAAPWSRQINTKLMEELGIPDTSSGRALFIHCLEQRAAGLTIVPTHPMVETAQRYAAAAAGVNPRVQVCARCNSLRATPAGEKQNKATCGTLLSMHRHSRTCANCGSTGSIVDLDATGYFYMWLSRHIDRDQRVAAVCAFCGLFSKVTGLIGILPACAGCHASQQKLKQGQCCAVCHKKIHKKTSAEMVLCVDPRSIDDTPQTKPVCRSCSDLESKEVVWDPSSLRQLIRCPLPRS